MQKCHYCEEDAKFQLKNGRWCCCKSSNSCPVQRRKNSRSNKKRGGPFRDNPEMYSAISRGKNKWNTGKSYEEVLGKQKADAYKKKLSNSLTGIATGYASTPEKEAEKRRKQSEAIKRRYAAGWMPKAGRCKKIKYSSPIAGEITVDGSWELVFAKFLDGLNINWRRNKHRFQYNYDGKDRYYTPDFFLPDDGIYIEVKGYRTKKDEAKWSQFPHQLKRVMKEEIRLIKQGKFTKKRLDGLDSHWRGTPDC